MMWLSTILYDSVKIFWIKSHQKTTENVNVKRVNDVKYLYMIHHFLARHVLNLNIFSNLVFIQTFNNQVHWSMKLSE